jgi:exopolysaccharide biosynthesis polyprenyl glycosylphosphotransferase
MPADAKKSERSESRPSMRGLRLPKSPNDVGASPAYYGRRKKRGNEICQILLRNGAVAPESVRAALRLQEESGGQIGRILVAMGACTEAALSHALLEQVALRARGPSVSRDARANPALAGLKVHCRPGLTRLVLMTADLVAIAIALLFSLGVYWVRASATGLEGLYLMVPQGFLCWVCIGALGLHGPMANSVPDEIRGMASASLLSLAGVGAVAIFGDHASRLWTLVSLAVFCLAASIALPLLRALVRARFAGQRWWGHPVVVLGAGKTGRLVVRRLLDQPSLGLKPVMMLDDDAKKHGTLRASFTNEVVEVTSRSASPHDVLSSTSLRAARELFARNESDERASDPPSGPRARGMFAEVEGVPVVGDLALAPVLAERLGIRYAIVAMPGVEAPRLVKLIERVGGVFSHLLIIPDLFGFGGVGVPSKDVGGVLGLEVRQQLLLPGPRLAKRFLDLLFTLLGGLVVAPVIALLALLVKLDSRGPVLYFQERLGQNGRRFWAAKLRTMHGDGEERLAAVLAQSPALRAEYEEFHKLTNDPRVTRVGRILRKYSLDELPQLWNVLRGDMSLVGPRPYLEREIGDMEQKEGIILRTVPGLTGMWQVSDRNATTFADRVRMDVFYVRNWSPWLDLYLLARTVAVVIRGTGV